MFSESRQITYPCKCQESKCSCCSGNILQNFNLNIRQRLCTNITYYADEFEFNVRILFNDYTVYNRVVSGMSNLMLFDFNYKIYKLYILHWRKTFVNYNCWHITWSNDYVNNDTDNNNQWLNCKWDSVYGTGAFFLLSFFFF